MNSVGAAVIMQQFHWQQSTVYYITAKQQQLKGVAA